MKIGYIMIVVTGLLAVGSLWWTSSVRAAPEATYQLVKSNVGSGGSGSSGAYSVSSSVGQHDAGEVRAGAYILRGGFWGGGVIVAAEVGYRAYLPLAIK